VRPRVTGPELMTPIEVYTRPGEAEREAEVQAHIAAVRARVRETARADGIGRYGR